jgi:hypothetical protein
VPTRRFLFALSVTNTPPFDEMLAEVAACVLGQAGYGREAIAEMLALLRETLARSAAQGLASCEVRFAAADEAWRVARPLP